MTITDSQILLSVVFGGKNRIIFIHKGDNGMTYGPYVEDRIAEEDQNSFVAAHAEKLQTELNPTDYYAVMEALLDANVGAGTYTALRKALKDIDGELVELNGSSIIQLNVTY